MNFTPAKNDGTTVHKLTVGTVPVDGFWSISLYDAKGYFEPNTYDAYTVNNLTAQKDANGLVTIQFGGCDGKIPNCLPIMQGWNYTVRLYRPRTEILNGKWKFPGLHALLGRCMEGVDDPLSDAGEQRLYALLRGGPDRPHRLREERRKHEVAR